MNKKAMDAGQIFAYVLTVVILAFVLFFGYTTIVEYKQKTEIAAMAAFESDLKDFVSSKMHFGDEDKSTFSVPGGYRQVCFTGTNVQKNSAELDKYPIIKDSVSSQNKIEKNVFFVRDTAESSIYIGKIDVENNVMVNNLKIGGGFACFEIKNGKIFLEARGLGDKTLIIKNE